MNGTAELRELANLLRIGAGAARDIAASRQRDRDEICALADQALAMASSLEAIASRDNADNVMIRHP